MIDLCKMFRVEEGEEFKIDKYKNNKYRIIDGNLEREYMTNYWDVSMLKINDIVSCEVIKLPKRKEFTDDELRILRNIDKEYKWIARDSDGKLFTYNKMPIKGENINKWKDASWLDFCMYDHLFQSIQWEDEEPVFIDDYVER